MMKKNTKVNKIKKTRKKRTTIKDAYANGYNDCNSKFMACTLDVIDKMIEEFNDEIKRYPRNTKFVELEMDAIMELRDKFIYNINNIALSEKNALHK